MSNITKVIDSVKRLVLREELVCSMIMISENAALRNSNKDDSFVIIVKSKSVRILSFNSVICSINQISVSVAVLQMRKSFSHNNKYYFTYLLQE